MQLLMSGGQYTTCNPIPHKLSYMMDLHVQKLALHGIGRLKTGGFFFQGLAPRFFSKVWLDLPSRFLVTVIIFGLLDMKSVNCHRGRGGHGRHPRNCRRFSTF